MSGIGGRLRLNGRPFEKDISKQARRNAAWLKDQIHDHLEIRVFVHACLVFSNAFVSVRGAMEGVNAIHISYLARYLTKLPPDRRIQELVLHNAARVRAAICS